MDLFTLGYYGAVCGFLAAGAPLLEGRLKRLLFGLTTGLIAATALPFLRDLMMGQTY